MSYSNGCIVSHGNNEIEARVGTKNRGELQQHGIESCSNTIMKMCSSGGNNVEMQHECNILQLHQIY